MSVINSFKDEYAFLSNMYPAQITWKGKIYKTSEHAYQSAKCTNETDAESVRLEISPYKAKRIARKLPMNDTFQESRIGIMYSVVFNKFSQNEDLKKLLLDTGDSELKEGNYWNDTFWGVCKGVGENHLGQILMGVRGDLREKII